MARHNAALNFLRPIFNVRHAAQLAAQFAALRLVTAGGLGATQAADQFAPKFAERGGIARGVNRLM